jgi:hypothetical protein
VSLLPKDFETLNPYVAKWAVDGTANRAALRGDSSHVERQSFYDAAAPLLTAALDHLDATPLNALDAAQQRLMALMLSLAHVSLAIEVQGLGEEKHRITRDEMIMSRSSGGV